MDLEEKQIFNRQNLYYEVAFLDALQHWRDEPNISFLRIFKETCQKRGIWPEGFNITREDFLSYIAQYMQISMAMQTICYTNEVVKETGLDQSSQDVKNALKNLKIKCDIDGKEKNTNIIQMLKIIREAFAHNDDSVIISNWEMGLGQDSLAVTIQSEIKKTGDRHNISLTFKDLITFAETCLTNLVDLDNNAVELDVNGVQLAKVCQQSYIVPIQVKKRIKQINKQTQEKIEIEDRQLQAVCNCFKNKFFHSKDIKESLASPFRPDFVARVFPYKFNTWNHISNLQLASNSLGHLTANYHTQPKWFKSVLDVFLKSSKTQCEDVTHLYYMFLTGTYDSIIITNMLFSIFSFETSTKLEEMFNDCGVEVNRIRNSVMHGRFYYDYHKGFDFYDGRNNQQLEYVGNLSIAKITEVAQKLINEYIEQIKEEKTV